MKSIMLRINHKFRHRLIAAVVAVAFTLTATPVPSFALAPSSRVAVGDEIEITDSTKSLDLAREIADKLEALAESRPMGLKLVLHFDDRGFVDKALIGDAYKQHADLAKNAGIEGDDYARIDVIFTEGQVGKIACRPSESNESKISEENRLRLKALSAWFMDKVLKAKYGDQYKNIPFPAKNPLGSLHEVALIAERSYLRHILQGEQPPRVLVTERTYHVDMFDWLTKEVPAIVGKEQLSQATLIHVDFHADTPLEFHLGTSPFLSDPSLYDRKVEGEAVTSANVISKIKEANIVKEIWWVTSPGTPHLIPKLVRPFFTQIQQLGEVLPSTDRPVILSIDFDAFASMEEGEVGMEELHRRIRTFLESLREKEYRVFAIFLAGSPDYTQKGCVDIIRTQLQEGLASLYHKTPLDAHRRLAANP